MIDDHFPRGYAEAAAEEDVASARLLEALEAFVVAVVEDMGPTSDTAEFLARADARDALLDALEASR